MDLPSEPQIRWTLRTMARLLQDGAEPVRGLVLPNGTFFPDRFDGSPDSVAQLTGRVLEHAGLSELKVGVEIVAPAEEAQAKAGGCSSGACATGPGAGLNGKAERLVRVDEGEYAMRIAAGEVRHPIVLTTLLARSVALMFLLEADAVATIPPADREASIDLTATLLGFGVLVTNGAHIYQKGCGGVAVHKATKMEVDELALALAIFCELFEASPRAAAKHMELTQREHLDESVAWAASNRKIVRLLRSDPVAIQDDRYALSEAHSWLARAFGIGKKKHVTVDEELAELEHWMSTATKTKTVDPQKAAKLAEIRALVDESFGR